MGLWLNEAFATFMEMLAVDHYRPAWQRWTTFGRVRVRPAAETSTGSTSSRPVEFPVAAPARPPRPMFDVLTYEKGRQAVLRMLGAVHGCGGVSGPASRAYLRRHAFGNTQTRDLWGGAGRGQPGCPSPKSWTAGCFRPGYPPHHGELGGRLSGYCGSSVSATCPSGRAKARPSGPAGAATISEDLPLAGSLSRSASKTPGGSAVQRVAAEPARGSAWGLPPDTQFVLVNEGGPRLLPAARYDRDPDGPPAGSP